MPSHGHAFAATAKNFAQLVLENSKKGLVLVDFWSPKAGPSRRQRDMLLRLSEQLGGRFLLATVNTDEEKGLARDYGVRSLPSFKLFRNGRVIEEVRGVQTEADYRGIVEKHLAGGAGGVQKAAMQAWSEGHRDRALQLLAEGVMQEPENPRLPLLMAKLLMQQERYGDAHELLAALPEPVKGDEEIVRLTAHLDFIVTAAHAPSAQELGRAVENNPGDLDSRYRLAAVCLVGDELDLAMEHLLAIQRLQADYREGAARRGLLALLDTLPPDDERVRSMRSALFNLAH